MVDGHDGLLVGVMVDGYNQWSMDTTFAFSRVTFAT